MKEFLEQWGNKAMHGISVLLLGSILGLDISGSSLHTHPELETVADNKEKIDKLYVLNLLERLDGEHRARCMGAGSQQTINELETEYRDETGERYVVRDCDYYMSL